MLRTPVPLIGALAITWSIDMFDASWIIFITASLFLIATPGQDMILVMSRSIALGPKAGIVTAGGVSVGLIGHTMLATLGVGAILRASELLFLALKLVGAAYLIHLGIGLLRAKDAHLLLGSGSNRSLKQLFFDGAFSNISNPKIAVFYFAFLPQFVSPSAENPATTIFCLGLSFALLTFIVKGPIGYFAGMLSAWLRSRPTILLWLYRGSGVVLLGLGVRLALERKQ